MPPYLAGREAEQALLRSLLVHVAGGEAPPSEVILYGPRGNGKTVLLGWVQAEGPAASVDVLRLTPSEIRDRAGFADTVFPRSWWTRHTPIGISVAGTGITWRPGRQGPPSVEAVLTARTRRKPLVLLLDEAHTLDRGLGRELLNASQSVGRERPFLLVLAGTPSLESHLAGMSASFWNRAEQVRVGRLSAAATADGFRRPFEDAEVPVSEAALAEMVRESQCYPFFLQVLGRAVWREVSGRAPGARRVTRTEVEAALPEFHRIRGDYYRQRYRELEALELLAVGRAVAVAFATRPLLGDAALHAAIGQGLPGADPARIVAAREALSDLGFVWEPGGAPEWEPGIPSLMDYVRSYAPAR